MKLFQQLLVAPCRPRSDGRRRERRRAEHRRRFEYASADQVTSVTQLSDVYPTDWATRL